MHKKILLLQTRESGLRELEERNVSRHFPPSWYDACNFLFDDLSELDPRNYDSVIMTGSAVSISDGWQPWFADAIRIIHGCEQRHIPFLGICFGMQMMTLALGGSVTKGNKVAGRVKIRTVRNTSRSIFGPLPDEFWANEVHSDHIVPPLSLVTLGWSDVCASEIVHHRDRPMGGVQFHPEHTRATGLEFVRTYDTLGGAYRLNDLENPISSFVDEQPPVIQHFLSL
ncbi:MAG: gamma-glutamyl-gamma-aminobutyrate hydrolase family protein [bacterium]|nr:gamma-glutamyl-gamma-aminobutyrate hydrolase family protein [bacterium]